MFSVVREPCANNSFLASFTPSGEHILLYMTTMNLPILYRVSELTSTGCRDRSRMDNNSTLTTLTFPATEEAKYSVAPIDRMEEHHCFFIDIFSNLVDSNLSKVSTDAKANPEFIKPKRREMLYCKGNHIISRSPCRAQCATWSRMRVSASSWERGWRYSTSFMSFCVETIVSSFVLMITFLSV